MEERYRTYFEVIGARIRRVRTARGMTIAQLADQVGVTASYLSLVERGKRAVRMWVLIGISEALEVPLPALMNEDADQLTRKLVVL